jgi:hypothetical protein
MVPHHGGEDRQSAPMIGPAESQGHEGEEGIDNGVRGSVEWEQWVPSKGRGQWDSAYPYCTGPTCRVLALKKATPLTY